jgi:hypothetical protein
MPVINAGASELDTTLRDAGCVSAALAEANVRHRFFNYDEANELVGYIHHEWPHPDGG